MNGGRLSSIDVLACVTKLECILHLTEVAGALPASKVVSQIEHLSLFKGRMLFLFRKSEDEERAKWLRNC